MHQSFIDLNDPIVVGLFILITTVVIFLRYVFVSGIFYAVFYIALKDKFAARKISQMARPKGQAWEEVKWSALTSFIFAISFVGLVWMWQNDHTAIYQEVTDFGWWYLPISLFLSLFLQETYYYWLHRWMHQPKIYRRVHKVHHNSIVTSPWTAFSFHPMESILQALMVPIIVFFLPMHYSMFALMLLIMTICGTINHLDIELYPKGFERHRLGKWLVGATHHSQHHARFIENYGLYFTFWDKWMKTESKDFEELFRSKTQ